MESDVMGWGTIDEDRQSRLAYERMAQKCGMKNMRLKVGLALAGWSCYDVTHVDYGDEHCACSHAIAWVYSGKTNDGKQVILGSECIWDVYKLQGKSDSKVKQMLKAAEREWQRFKEALAAEKRHTEYDEKIVRLYEVRRHLKWSSFWRDFIEKVNRSKDSYERSVGRGVTESDLPEDAFLSKKQCGFIDKGLAEAEKSKEKRKRWDAEREAFLESLDGGKTAEVVAVVEKAEMRKAKWSSYIVMKAKIRSPSGARGLWVTVMVSSSFPPPLAYQSWDPNWDSARAMLNAPLKVRVRNDPTYGLVSDAKWWKDDEVADAIRTTDLNVEEE